MHELGSIKIFFGNVVSITDDKYICRIKATINGITDKFTKDKLPYYYPYYGVNYLPQEDDVVPIIIFDNNFSSGFYGKKINVTSLKTLGNNDYENYLEVFKRTINNNSVELSYTESDGIVFLNGSSLVNIGINELSLICGDNELIVTSNEIKLGSDADQFALKGDEVVEVLSKLAEIVTKLASQFTAMNSTMISFMSGCGSPFTASLAPGFTLLTTNMTMLYTNAVILSSSINAALLQSKKVKIE